MNYFMEEKKKKTHFIFQYLDNFQETLSNTRPIPIETFFV